VGTKCGFVMEEDRLRIPSTKRICFIGRQKNHDDSGADAVKDVILGMIPDGGGDGHCDGGEEDGKRSKRQKSEKEFVPRPPEIRVRNCTKLDRELKDTILEIILKRLLQTKRPLSEVMAPFKAPVNKVRLGWNCGDDIALSEMAGCVPQHMLK
jgi:tRNASer (uridine44-2'-O)-methyltransferase